MLHDGAEKGGLQMLPFAIRLGDGDEIRAEKDARHVLDREKPHGERRALGGLAAGADEDDGHAAHEGEDGEIVSQIKEILDTRVRPAVAQDGGDITFQGYEGGIVFLNMQGACAGCPSSTVTLKRGVENMLKHYIPEIVEVRQI